MKASSLSTEFLISPHLVLVALLAVSCLFSLGAETFFFPWSITSKSMALLIVFSLITLCGLSLLNYIPWLGRWFTIFGLAVMVHSYGVWLHFPGSLGWAVIPVAFAACLVGISAAAVTAIAESVFVVLVAGAGGASVDLAVVATPLVAIWAIFAAMVAVSYEVHQRALWLAAYLRQAQQQLEATRNHRADLMQALADLEHANRQLALLNQRVIALQRLAEEAQKAKTSFVARVSHEFRTPLNMIIGLTDLIVERPEIYDATLSPRLREALQIVHRNSQHLSDMVNDVLDLSRLESDHLVLHRERVPICEIIAVAVEAVRPLLENKKLALGLAIGEDLPAVYCDRTRIEQVLLNLVSNATRYTDHGQITIAATQRGQAICVRVTDTGQGIAPADRERIFEPFAQGSSATWRDKGGSGLGLSISKQFIELHGGRIWVESTLGVGTTFVFELPISSPLDHLYQLQQAAGPAYKIDEDWIWHERRSSPKVPATHLRPRLVVYDESGNLFNTLQHFAGAVELVDTRTRSVALAALAEAPAHALLLNLNRLDELRPWVGALPKTSQGTPIIGCSVPPSLTQARSSSLRGQLIKPITRASLTQALQSLDTPIKRVLVVDDGVDEVALLCQMLRAYDATLEILMAHDGKTALETLCTQPPDLLLLDIVMPEMDGWQVLEAMAGNDNIPSVPTFFVSAQDPYEQPPRSSFMAVTTEAGLSLPQLLRCSLVLSNLLLQPERRLDLAPE